MACFFTTLALPENHFAEEPTVPASSKSMKVSLFHNNISCKMILLCNSLLSSILFCNAFTLCLSGSKQKTFPVLPTHFEKNSEI